MCLVSASENNILYTKILVVLDIMLLLVPIMSRMGPKLLEMVKFVTCTAIAPTLYVVLVGRNSIIWPLLMSKYVRIGINYFIGTGGTIIHNGNIFLKDTDFILGQITYNKMSLSNDIQDIPGLPCCLFTYSNKC